MAVGDRLLVGRKAARHAAAGDALTLDQWLGLPGALDGAEWYVDTISGNLVAVMDGGVDRVVKAVFDPKTGLADTVFVVPADSVVSSIKGNNWRALTPGRGT